MLFKIRWGSLLTASSLALTGVACGDGQGPAEGQAHYRSYRPPADSIPTEYAGTRCYEAYAGIGAEVPLRANAGTGVPELPTGVEGTYPKDPGGPVQDGQVRPSGGGPYEISCVVKGSGAGPYQVSAELVGANLSDYAKTPSTTSIKLTATIGPDGKGVGDVGFYSFESKSVRPLPGRNCTLEVVPDPATGSPLIAPGSAFLIFKCEGASSDGVGSYCSSEGTVILGNCGQ